MVGWQTLRDDVEMLGGAKHAVRLEAFRIEVTVQNEKKLQELAWMSVEQGFVVNLHSRTSITIIGGKNEECVIEARVRVTL